MIWKGKIWIFLSILMERSKRKENGITNKEIRQITHYNRQQVTRLINQLRKEHTQIQIEGHGAGAHYVWQSKA
jgi:ATP-dependent DNA helicase RecG